MPTIQYPNHPNTDTAFVVQDDGTKNRALMTAPQDTSTLELPKNANSCKGYVTINGKKQRVVMTADVLGGGSGGGLPDQTGNAGKFLTTDGTDASWSDKPLTNSANTTINTGVLAVGTITNNIGSNTQDSVAIGYATRIGNSIRCLAIGYNARVNNGANNGIAIGWGAYSDATYAIQLGATSAGTTNSDANTFKVANHNGNYELMSADGTVPEARLADTTNATAGQVLTLDSNLNAVWQAGGSGGGLPDQTGNAGKFLVTNGTNASWDNSIDLKGKNKITLWCSGAYGFGGLLELGYAGSSSATQPTDGVRLGADFYGFKVYNLKNAQLAPINTSKLIAPQIAALPSSNVIDIPNVAGEMAVKSVNTTITLTAAGWSNGSQTVTVSGITSTGVVFVSPDPTDQTDYTTAGIICTAQATDSLTFTCDTTPSNDIDVVVVQM